VVPILVVPSTQGATGRQLGGLNPPSASMSDPFGGQNFHAQRYTLPPYFTPGQIAELTRQHRAEQDRAKQFLRLHVLKILGAQANDLKMKFDLVDTHPVDAVLDAAKRHGADLIIMGTHGRECKTRLLC
jgi:nucleotide-binding universal stress UspA family protein